MTFPRPPRVLSYHKRLFVHVSRNAVSESRTVSSLCAGYTHVQRLHTANNRKGQFTNTKLITTVPYYLVREQNFLEAGRIKLPRGAVLQKLIRRVVHSLPCAVQMQTVGAFANRCEMRLAFVSSYLPSVRSAWHRATRASHILAKFHIPDFLLKFVDMILVKSCRRFW